MQYNHKNDGGNKANMRRYNKAGVTRGRVIRNKSRICLLSVKGREKGKGRWNLWVQTCCIRSASAPWNNLWFQHWDRTLHSSVLHLQWAQQLNSQFEFESIVGHLKSCLMIELGRLECWWACHCLEGQVAHSQPQAHELRVLGWASLTHCLHLTFSSWCWCCSSCFAICS